MTPLQQARGALDTALWSRGLTIWAWYKNETLDSSGAVAELHDAWIAELHKFYLLRDGPNGFLGGKGL